MAGEKKLIRDVTLGRDKEIRVRYVKKEDLQALSECSRILGTKSIPDTVLKLIHSFKNDQSLLKQLQARNNQLNASLLAMVEERDKAIKLIADFIKYTDRFNDMTIARAKGILKKMNSKRGTKQRRLTR